MTLDEWLEVGVTVPIGSHHFSAEAIKAFAQKYDPQAFHTDEQKARESVLGGLCASGWHTAAAWMKCNIATPINREGRRGTGDCPEPEMGPSPGFTNMKWLKPVYAGETVSYTRKVIGHRPMASRPGWRLVSLHSEGFDSKGDKVIEFDSSVMVKVE